MKRAARLILTPMLFQRHARVYDVNDIASRQKLINKLSRNHSSHKISDSYFGMLVMPIYVMQQLSDLGIYKGNVRTAGDISVVNTEST